MSRLNQIFFIGVLLIAGLSFLIYKQYANFDSGMPVVSQIFQADRGSGFEMSKKPSPVLRAKVADVDALAAKAIAQGYVRVIVTLKGATVGSYFLPLPSSSTKQPSAPNTGGLLGDGQSATVEQEQIILTHLGADEAKRRRWSPQLIRSSPYMGVTVNFAELEALAADNAVVSIQESGVMRPL